MFVHLQPLSFEMRSKRRSLLTKWRCFLLAYCNNHPACRLMREVEWRILLHLVISNSDEWLKER